MTMNSDFPDSDFAVVQRLNYLSWSGWSILTLLIFSIRQLLPKLPTVFSSRAASYFSFYPWFFVIIGGTIFFFWMLVEFSILLYQLLITHHHYQYRSRIFCCVGCQIKFWYSDLLINNFWRGFSYSLYLLLFCRRYMLLKSSISQHYTILSIFDSMKSYCDTCLSSP